MLKSQEDSQGKSTRKSTVLLAVILLMGCPIPTIIFAACYLFYSCIGKKSKRRSVIDVPLLSKRRQAGDDIFYFYLGISKGDVTCDVSGTRMVYVVAPYQAKGEGELTLSEGDQVRVLKLNDNGGLWWYGQLNEKRGFFQWDKTYELENYVEDGKGNWMKAKPDPNDASHQLKVRVGDAITLLEKNSDGWWYGEAHGKKGYFPADYTSQNQQKKKKEPPRANVGEIVHAMYESSPSDESELTLKVGDQVRVMEKNSDGWWFGQKVMGGQQGYFPCDYTSDTKKIEFEDVKVGQKVYVIYDYEPS